MLWLGVLLWAGSGLAQEEAAVEDPKRSAEEQAQREEVKQVWEAYMEAYRRGDYEEAARGAERERELLAALVGEEHADYATSLNNLAMFYQSKGSYEQALPLHQQAVEIRRNALGEDHPHYATSLNNLAKQYTTMGSYEQALPLYQQAMEIRRTALGEDHPDYAQSLNSLAILYKDMGS